MSDLPLPEPVTDEALTIQHDLEPAQDHGIAKRTPNIGHAATFFALVAFCLLISSLIFFVSIHATTPEAVKLHPLGEVVTQLIAYIATLGLAFPLFALIWRKPFLNGIHWTWRAVQLHWWKLLALGIACSIAAQAANHFLHASGDTDLVRYFNSPGSAWLLVICGGLVIPLMEEVAFRGFLLPALAIAYDWCSLERTPVGLQRWQQTTALTRNALIFATVISSLAFTLIHGFQLHWSRPTLAVLFIISMIFAGIRIRYNSLAASTLVHIAYDGLIFLELIVTTGGFRHLDKLT